MATVRVVDDTGRPVGGAQVVASYALPPTSEDSGEWMHITGKTDTNGVLTVSHIDRSVYLSFQAHKTGYYSYGFQHDVGFSPQDHPERLRPNVTLLLRRVINPIPMYAKRVREGPPVLGKQVGYDMEIGDWIAPFGKGKNSHILFEAHLDKRAENDWDYKLVVSFPNPGDGIQEFAVSDLQRKSPLRSQSPLRSPHEAPPHGYQPQWVKTKSRAPGEPSTVGVDDSLNFFFRVRTVLDEQANVKSALYGKIYGDFMDFQYFLNPETNSRNIEFDPTKNLLKKLGPSEHVRVP
jgi:hypothetical protein